MAKKKKDPKVPATQLPEQSQSSGGSRHRDRRMVSLPQAIYDQLTILAERNNRPLAWEVRAVLIRHLQANGLWPVEEESASEGDSGQSGA